MIGPISQIQEAQQALNLGMSYLKKRNTQMPEKKFYLDRNKGKNSIKFLIGNHINKGNEVLQMLEEK